MNARLILIATLTVGFTLGCMGGETTVTEAPKPAPAADTPEQKAAKVANAIAAGNADEALKEAGMSAEEFEALMFDIAKDPKRTDAYLDARK